MDSNLYLLFIVAFAGVIHTGFSLGTSMLTLLSGHSLSRRRSHARLLSLTGGFVLGSFAMILLLLLAFAYIGQLIGAISYTITYLALGTVIALAGLWVIFFYYRRGKGGSALWLPRSFARYLSERAAHTKSPFESFVLGAASVIYELPITVWLLLTASISVAFFGPHLQIATLLGYSILAVVSLLIVFILIGGGHTAAALTRFRSQHKRFLQIVIGLSMIILGGALFWNEFSSIMDGVGVVVW